MPPRSPLAPAQQPSCRRSPACGWRPAPAASATRTAPIVCLMAFDTGHDRRRRVHPLAHRLGAGRSLPRATSRAARRGRSSSTPAMPMPSPASWATASVDRTVKATAAKLGCLGEGDLRRLHRRHRRAAARRADHGSLAGSGVADLQADGWAGGGRGDHDHRHLRQARHPHGADRRRARDHQRHRQGLGHDPARHGDHAGLRRHRCEAAGRGAAARCCAKAPTAPSTASPSTATPPPATRCCCARPARPATGR